MSRRTRRFTHAETYAYLREQDLLDPSVPTPPEGFRLLAWKTTSGRRSAVHLCSSTNLLASPVCKGWRGAENRLVDQHDLHLNVEASGVCSKCPWDS
jgi:hypothetical protein